MLGLIKQRVERKGEAPSYRAIADALDMSVPDVCNVVRRLERRGLLKRRAVGARKNQGWHKSVVELRESS